MHPAAYDWVAAHTVEASRVLDIGGRDINGTIRPLFNGAEFTSIDLYGGLGVDVIGDVADYKPRSKFDVVVCCEVLEHTATWQNVIAAAHRLTRRGGLFICTAAGPGRVPHSAFDGGPIREDEYYQNITPEALSDTLDNWADVIVDSTGEDVRAVATR